MTRVLSLFTLNFILETLSEKTRRILHITIFVCVARIHAVAATVACVVHKNEFVEFVVCKCPIPVSCLVVLVFEDMCTLELGPLSQNQPNLIDLFEL